MADFHKLLRLFESKAGVQSLRMRPGTLPWVVSHDQPIVLDLPPVAAEDTAVLIDEFLADADRRCLERWGVASFRHPDLPVLVCIERRGGEYEVWCQRVTPAKADA